MSDKITIKDLEVFARIGCTESERVSSQRICLDITYKLDGARAALTKSLDDSVCYLTLSNSVRELVSSSEWALVEELSYTVASKILNKFKLVEEVEVEIRKFVLPATAYVSFSTKLNREQ